MSVRDGVDERIKVECRQIRILCLDKHHIGSVVPILKNQIKVV